jgi:hypothetical protein
VASGCTASAIRNRRSGDDDHPDAYLERNRTSTETGNDIKRVYVVGLVVAATLMVADVALMGLGLAIGL